MARVNPAILQTNHVGSVAPLACPPHPPCACNHIKAGGTTTESVVRGRQLLQAVEVVSVVFYGLFAHCAQDHRLSPGCTAGKLLPGFSCFPRTVSSFPRLPPRLMNLPPDWHVQIFTPRKTQNRVRISKLRKWLDTGLT